jgi:hypothetical protein
MLVLFVNKMKKMQSLLVVLLVFSLVWVSFLQVGDVKAQSTVYIRNDGTIEGTDKIQQNEDTYTFTGDITGAVVLEKGV